MIRIALKICPTFMTSGAMTSTVRPTAWRPVGMRSAGRLWRSIVASSFVPAGAAPVLSLAGASGFSSPAGSGPGEVRWTAASRGAVVALGIGREGAGTDEVAGRAAAWPSPAIGSG